MKKQYRILKKILEALTGMEERLSGKIEEVGEWALPRRGFLNFVGETELAVPVEVSGEYWEGLVPKDDPNSHPSPTSGDGGWEVLSPSPSEDDFTLLHMSNEVEPPDSATPGTT